MSLNPGPLVPLVTSTCPSASSVAFIWRRANCIPGTLRHAGAAWLRSITSAEFVGGSPPPAYRILPGAYMTAEPSLRSATIRLPTVVHCTAARHVQVPRGRGEAGQEHLAVRRHEHRRVVWIGDRQAGVGQPAPGAAVPDLRNGDDRAALVGAGDGQDLAARQGGGRRVVAALRHRAGGAPGPRRRVEDHRPGVAIGAGDGPAGDQQPAVRQEGVPAAKDSVGLAQRGEAGAGFAGSQSWAAPWSPHSSTLRFGSRCRWMPTTGVWNAGPHVPRTGRRGGRDRGEGGADGAGLDDGVLAGA